MPGAVGYLDDSLSAAWAGTGTIAGGAPRGAGKAVPGLERGLSVTE